MLVKTKYTPSPKFEKIRYVCRTKAIRDKLLFMLACLVIIRAGSQIPLPGIDRAVVAAWFADSGGMFNLFDMFSGGSLSNMSIFAISITPIITASIIMELMTIVIPALKEMQEDETGRQKKAKITKYVGIGLAAIQAFGTMFLFKRQGAIPQADPLRMIAVCVAMVAGSAFLMWLADILTEKGFGNGTSFILLVNIASRVPALLVSLYEQFIDGQNAIKVIIAVVLIVVITVVTITLVVILEGGERRVPIINARKIAGTMGGGVNSTLPLKVNMAGVIPIIFAQTLMSIPSMLSAFTGSGNKVLAIISSVCNDGNWFDVERPLYTVGFFFHLLLIFGFAYFYTDISFSPRETADNLRKQGSTVPGIRPGKPTEMFLNGIVKNLVFIGAVGLVIVTTIPMLTSGLTHANIAIGGTSVIIVTGVIIEIVREIDAELVFRYNRGFLGKGGH